MQPPIRTSKMLLEFGPSCLHTKKQKCWIVSPVSSSKFSNSIFPHSFQLCAALSWRSHCFAGCILYTVVLLWDISPQKCGPGLFPTRPEKADTLPASNNSKYIVLVKFCLLPSQWCRYMAKIIIKIARQTTGAKGWYVLQENDTPCKSPSKSHCYLKM